MDKETIKKICVILLIFIGAISLVYVLTNFTYLKMLSGDDNTRGLPENAMYYSSLINTLLITIFGYLIYCNTKKEK